MVAREEGRGGTGLRVWREPKRKGEVRKEKGAAERERRGEGKSKRRKSERDEPAISTSSKGMTSTPSLQTTAKKKRKN